jgi:xylulokinase
MKQFILAHDLGTTGNKATLYDSEGRLAGSAFSPYATEYAHPGWAEQNPHDWWKAVCDSTHYMLSDYDVPKEEIACIVFSGQMMSCIPVDQGARPLSNAIIWADQRAVEQERWLSERIDPEEVYQITGHRLSPSYSLPKMLWLRDHQPEIFTAAKCFLHAKDFVIAKLTGAFVTDASDASGMNLYDLEMGTWSEKIIEAAEFDASKLPVIYQSIDVVGEVTTEAAEAVGVAAGTPVVAGGGDGVCAATGAGVTCESLAYTYIGSSAWIALATPHPVYDPGKRTNTFAHMRSGLFMPTGSMQAAGASYQWLRDQWCCEEYQAALEQGESPYEFMNSVAAGSPAGANGLLYLPYLMGERSPRWNPKARGAFIGLTIRHSRADMIRAVLEGVTLNLKAILAAFLSQGIPIEAIRLIGGGAKGRFWNRIMADIFGMPVHRLQTLEEATSMGAAVAGGVGVGLFHDLSVSQQMNPVAETFLPDPATQEIYRRATRLFESAYTTLEPLFDQMAAA